MAGGTGREGVQQHFSQAVDTERGASINSRALDCCVVLAVTALICVFEFSDLKNGSLMDLADTPLLCPDHSWVTRSRPKVTFVNLRHDSSMQTLDVGGVVLV